MELSQVMQELEHVDEGVLEQLLKISKADAGLLTQILGFVDADGLDNPGNLDKWDFRYLKLAAEVSTWSKDPSTQCGTVIVRPDKSVASLGFNGFPRGMDDSREMYANRDEKYDRIIHAEVNAMDFAIERLDGCTLYLFPFLTCHRCAIQVIQRGIKRVVAPAMSEKLIAEKGARWMEPFRKARSYYDEAGVVCDELPFNLATPAVAVNGCLHPEAH